jgi:hypothetical protein
MLRMLRVLGWYRQISWLTDRLGRSAGPTILPSRECPSRSEHEDG